MDTPKSPAEMFQDQPPKKPDLSPKEYEATPVPPKMESEEVEPVENYVKQPMGNVVDLPSRGLLGYPAMISYREIMAGDEEILKTATNKNFSRTVNSVLSSICNSPDFFDDMYIGDRDYALTYIWANTYDNIKEFEVKCKHCGTKEEMSIDLYKVDTDEIKENFKARFPMTIKKTGEKVSLRLVTVRDDNNAETYLANNPKEEHSYEMIHYALAVEFGRPMSTRERIEYFKNNVSAKEMGVIKEFHRYFKFGLNTSFEHVCSECEGVTPGHIPFLPEDIIAPEVRTDFEQLLRAE